MDLCLEKPEHLWSKSHPCTCSPCTWMKRDPRNCYSFGNYSVYQKYNYKLLGVAFMGFGTCHCIKTDPWIITLYREAAEIICL